MIGQRGLDLRGLRLQVGIEELLQIKQDPVNISGSKDSPHHPC